MLTYYLSNLMSLDKHKNPRNYITARHNLCLSSKEGITFLTLPDRLLLPQLKTTTDIICNRIILFFSSKNSYKMQF